MAELLGSSQRQSLEQRMPRNAHAYECVLGVLLELAGWVTSGSAQALEVWLILEMRGATASSALMPNVIPKSIATTINDPAKTCPRSIVKRVTTSSVINMPSGPSLFVPRRLASAAAESSHREFQRRGRDRNMRSSSPRPTMTPSTAR